MFYIIDYDTGQVESKSKTELPLTKYIAENKLELAVALVSNAEELCLKLSLREMKRIWNNRADYGLPFATENKIADSVFTLLESQQRQIPTFNKRLGKRLIKEAKKRCPDVREKKTSKLSTTKKAAKQPTKRTRKETSKLKSIFGKF